MICLSCLGPIKNDIQLNNYFKREYHSICLNCLKKETLHFMYEVIPLDEGQLIRNTILKTIKKANTDCFMSFYKPYIMDYIKHRKHMTLLIFDHVDDEILVLLNDLKWGMLYIIETTLYRKGSTQYEI